MGAQNHEDRPGQDKVKRGVLLPALPRGEELTRSLVGPGMLLAASIEGVEHDDLRVLALLTTWLGAHHPWVNVDRPTRAVAEQSSSPSTRPRSGITRRVFLAAWCVRSACASRRRSRNRGSPQRSSPTHPDSGWCAHDSVVLEELYPVDLARPPTAKNVPPQRWPVRSARTLIRRRSWPGDLSA